MRLNGFFSGAKFLIENYQYIYCYGNQPSIIHLRWDFLKWWYYKQGYSVQVAETLADAQPVTDLFSCGQSYLYHLKKMPKKVGDILNTPTKIFWQSPGKNSLHMEALNNKQIAAIPCYDIKTDDMVTMLTFYLFHEFHLEAKDLQDVASYLCHEPRFFFSQAFKLALGDTSLPLKDLAKDDVMGHLRLRSAILLKTIPNATSLAPFHELARLRQQEVIYKSGSKATHALLDYMAKE